jgi:hypothetical protein
MPDEKTGCDSIRFYNTGAAADGNAQTDPDASLGNFRSGTEVTMIACSVQNPISNITIDYVGGANGEGSGTLTATADDDLRYTPPGGSQGPTVTIANGETKILEGGGGATEKYIRVSRTSATALSGTATLVLTYSQNNVVALDDVSSSEATAGDDEYRCVAIKNDSSGTVKDVKVKLKSFGTQQTSDSGQLGASGAGTITTSGSFSDWPETGYCAIYTSGGSEREIVYYSSRTTTALTVPAAGRGLLGTSAAAGAATDTVDAIPGVGIGKDDPTSQPSGSFVDNTGADEDTAPAGITFTSPILDADAVDIGDLLAGYIYGVWIHRETPAGAVGQSGMLHDLEFAFDAA